MIIWVELDPNGDDDVGRRCCVELVVGLTRIQNLSCEYGTELATTSKASGSSSSQGSSKANGQAHDHKAATC